MDETNRIVSELMQLCEQDRSKPFPYEGCRTLLKETDEPIEGFIPDLALYFAEIFGYASGAKRLKRWTQERMQKARIGCSMLFFEKHPEYKEVVAHITPEQTPDLYASWVLYEEMRVKILLLLDMVI